MMDTYLSTPGNNIKERIEDSFKTLKPCELCEHRCRVDRTREKTGYCKATDRVYVHAEFLHYGIEFELIPSYAIFFSGCSMRCLFCSSMEGLKPDFGIPLHPVGVAQRVDHAAQKGAKTVLFVGGEPTIHPQGILEIARYRRSAIPFVLDTNLYMTETVFPLLEGVVGIYLADFKFGNDQCASQIAAVPRYLGILQRNLLLANSYAGVIVRHVLLPGHLDCCFRPIIDWISSHIPNVKFHLVETYEPAFLWKKNDGLDRKIIMDEWNQAVQYAKEADLNLIT